MLFTHAALAACHVMALAPWPPMAPDVLHANANPCVTPVLTCRSALVIPSQERALLLTSAGVVSGISTTTPSPPGVHAHLSALGSA